MMMAPSPGKVSRRKANPRRASRTLAASRTSINNNQQPPYPPREQSQPYGGQQPNSNYQGRPQHQPQQNQPYSPPPQPYQPPQPQPVVAGASDVERLPSFITGSQPQPNAAERRAERL